MDGLCHFPCLICATDAFKEAFTRHAGTALALALDVVAAEPTRFRVTGDSRLALIPSVDDQPLLRAALAGGCLVERNGLPSSCHHVGQPGQ